MAATIRDVARAAGKSVAAASAVLSGTNRSSIRVSPETRERILAAARDLGYTPHPQARSLATRRAGALGLVFPYVQAFTDRNPFCSQVMAGAFDEAVRLRQNVMLFTAVAGDSEPENVHGLVSPRVDGLICVLPARCSPVVDLCCRKGFPCVTVVHGPIDPAECSVNADDFAGGRMATEHLVGLGHRRIAHLTGEMSVASALPRLKGYQAAMADAGLTVGPEMTPAAGFDRQHGVRAMRRLLELPAKRRPTAVFAANDLCAVGALETLKDAGLRAPDDVAVVGYDDTWLATTTDPPLTSVHMPIYEMGVTAAAMLVTLIDGEAVPDRRPVLPVSLTVRQSSAA